MSELDEVLGQLRQRIGRYRDQALGEQNTKSILIEPLLRALGWDVEDFEEVHREYKPKPTDNPVDYALFILRTPRLFVEAKALGGNLDDRRWANQIMGYAGVTGVAWVVLTDGDEYRVYNSHAPVPIEDKLFRRVRVSDRDPRVAETLELLSKERMRENLIESLWKSAFVDQQVRSSLEALVGPEPDPAFVRFVRNRLPTLSPAEVRESLNRVRLRFDFPAVAGQPVRPVQERGTVAKRPAAGAGSASGEGTPWRDVTVEDLIAAGFITPPLEVHKTYKGHRLSAVITEAGGTSWKGREFNSLSTAAGHARASIIGTPPGRKYPQTNGWTFWEFVDGNGQPQPLDALRQRHYRATVATQ